MAESIPTDAELWRQSERLRALARTLLSDPASGEDLVQETWLAALRRPRAIRRSAEGWLVGALRHLAWRTRERERRRGAVEERAARGELVEGPDEAVARAELQERLWRAVLALDEPYRSAVILRHLDQLEPREIARRQGCSPEAARQRVARGLQQLRARLDGEHGGRERWCVVFSPLALPAHGAQATLGAGGVLMSKWVAVAVGLLMFCAWWWGSGANGGRRAGAAEEASIAAAPVAAETSPSQDGSTREALHVLDAVIAPLSTVAPDERLLRGRVVDPTGAPVPGARVMLRRPELRGFSSLDLELDPQGEKVLETDTDREGLFSFDVGPDRPFDIWAEKSGLGEAVSADRFAGHTVELRLTSAFLIQGRVTRASDGRPVGEAWVRASRSRDHGLLLRRKTRTDADGRYELRLPVGDGLRVDVCPRVEQGRYSLRPEFDAQGVALLDVQVADGQVVEGSVTDADTGLPIAGALVAESWTKQRSTTTDAAGRYRFTGFGADGVYDLHASAEGYAAAVDYPAPSADGVSTVDFVLRRARSAHGRVVGPSGSPVADVYVAAIGSGAAGEVDWSAARTDADGRFRCEGLRPELRHTLLLNAPEFASVYHDFPDAELSSLDVDLGTLSLLPPGRITGRVLDAQGEPVPGARVRLEGHNTDRRQGNNGEEESIASSYTSERSTRADEQGGFRFVDVAPGRYRLAGTAQGRASSPSVEVELTSTGARAEVEVRFADGVDLVGHVVDERGLALAGILVRIQAERVVGGTRVSTSLRSAVDGAFVAHQLPPDRTYWIQVLPWETPSDDPCAPWLYSYLEAVDPAAGPVTFVRRRGVCIEGRVVDEIERPRHGLRIELRNSLGESGLGTSTDSEGRFLLGVEPDTTWTLTFSGPKGDAAFAELHVERNVAAGTRDLVLRLKR